MWPFEYADFGQQQKIAFAMAVKDKIAIIYKTF